MHSSVSLPSARQSRLNAACCFVQVLEPVQQAKLMVAAHPFALDLLAICSIVAENSSSFSVLSNSLALLSQLPQDSPFQALTPNKAP